MFNIGKWVFCGFTGISLSAVLCIPAFFIYYALGLDAVRWTAYSAGVLFVVTFCVFMALLHEDEGVTDNLDDEKPTGTLPAKQILLRIFTKDDNRLLSKITLGSDVDYPGGDDKAIAFFNFHQSPSDAGKIRIVYSNKVDNPYHREESDNREMSNDELIVFTSMSIVKFCKEKGFEYQLPMSATNCHHFHDKHGSFTALMDLEASELREKLEEHVRWEKFNFHELRPAMIIVSIDRDKLNQIEVDEEGTHLRKWEELLRVSVGAMSHDDGKVAVKVFDISHEVECQLQVVDNYRPILAKKKLEFTLAV